MACSFAIVYYFHLFSILTGMMIMISIDTSNGIFWEGTLKYQADTHVDKYIDKL